MPRKDVIECGLKVGSRARLEPATNTDRKRLGCFELSPNRSLVAKVQSGSGSWLKIIAGLAAQSKQLIQTIRDLRQLGRQ